MNRLLAVAAVAVCASTGSALAATYSFTNITGNSATNAAAGEAQLSLTTLAGANAQLVRFNLANASGMASVVKAVFVDDSAGVLASVSGFTATTGVSFKTGTNGSLPGGNSLAESFDEDHAIGVRAKNPAPSNGVNAGEMLDWSYTLAAGKTLTDVEAALNSGALRFGVHVISWSDGGSEAFVTTPSDVNTIPAPLSAVMGGAGLCMLAARRRRN